MGCCKQILGKRVNHLPIFVKNARLNLNEKYTVILKLTFKLRLNKRIDEPYYLYQKCKSKYIFEF